MIPLLVLATAGGLFFFALVETAFGLLMRLPQRLEAEREADNPALAAYLDDPLKFFVPSRLLRATLVVVMVALLAQVMEPGFAGALVLLASGTALAVGVGQLLPAVVVRRSPDRILDLLLPAFTVAANIVAPFTAAIIAWMGPPRAAARNGEPAGRPDQMSHPPDSVDAESADQNRLLRSVVNFGETLVREVMTPRPDIVAIEADQTIADLRRLVQEQEYSRLPVFTENLDNILGIVVVKDLIQRTDVPDDGHLVREVMRPAAFVPETKRVVDLLREFQQTRFQLALVVDEYGGTAGLVTVEDVLEELVGEIRDEYDLEAEPIVREAGDTFVFSGKVGIGEMAERLGVEIEDGDFETVGGFVLARVGRVPAVGERFELDGLDVAILEAERRRIHKVRVRRLTAPAAGVAG
jgi:CBS domain containing-hemolysin-like protein